MLEKLKSAHAVIAPIDDQNRARFVALWRRCPVDASARADEFYDYLVKRYSEPHRHYHTLEHVQRCLEKLDQAVALIKDPDAVEMALWLHDAIYNLNMKDNEQRSTEILQVYAGENADSVFLQKVCDLIMATAHHEIPEDQDACFIADIDLYSFGQSWDDFRVDEQLLRKEHICTADEHYYPEQLRFLNMLQDRPTFFLTDFFRQRYEQVAQDNIQKLIAQLHADGY